MHRLEGLEDKGVARGGRLDAVREGGINKVNEKGRWEEGNIGVVGVIRGEEIRTAGKGIGASEEFSGNMDHF